MSAPFRVNRRFERAIANPDVVAAAGAAGGGEKTRAYLDRLIPLIPSEIVTLYLAGASYIGPNLEKATENDRSKALGWAVFCFLCLLGLRIWGTADKRRNVPTEWWSVGIAVGAYLIWLYNIGCPFDLICSCLRFDPKIGPLLILGWTFVIPMIYHGDNFNGPEGQVAEGE